MNKIIKLSTILLFVGISNYILASTETRSLDNFTKVSVSSGIEAVLVKGTKNQIHIETDNIELDKIETEVSGDKLRVRVEESWWKFNWTKKRKVSVTITYTSELKAISASSGSSVSSQNVINSNELDLNSSSGANLKLEIDVTKVEANASSGAQLDLRGKASSLDVDVSSGAGFNGYDLVSDDVMAEASSGANARVWASNKIKADASSGGSISYKGSPGSKDVNKSSGGSVNPK